jgi:hypothetical protein
MSARTDVTVDGRSLQDLFLVTGEDLKTRISDKMLMDAARDEDRKLAQWVAVAKPANFCDQVADQVSNSLQENLAGVFASAWAKYSELKECARETQKDPKSTMGVSLADHEFTWETDCGVDVQLDGVKVATIPFTFAVACAVSGLELMLRAGAVYQVASGKADCRAEIKCAGTVVYTRALGGVSLPGELHLAKPIALDN